MSDIAAGASVLSAMITYINYNMMDIISRQARPRNLSCFEADYHYRYRSGEDRVHMSATSATLEHAS